jgi:predicted RNA polymerase sigma factor
MSVQRSPIVALNRAIAIAEHEGPEKGLAEIALIEDRERLASYPFYHAAQGELQLRRGQLALARCHFQDAIATARNPMERAFLERRLRACDAR